jgi:hypothetical protein
LPSAKPYTGQGSPQRSGADPTVPITGRFWPNRVVAPTSKLGLVDWWKSTAADGFTKIKSGVLDHRRFWDAMQTEQLAEIEQALPWP